MQAILLLKSEKKEEKPEYHFPPIQLLSLSENNNDKNAAEEMHNNAKKLIDTLDSFNVKASIVNICRGPSVTRYELSSCSGCKDKQDYKPFRRYCT